MIYGVMDLVRFHKLRYLIFPLLIFHAGSELSPGKEATKNGKGWMTRERGAGQDDQDGRFWLRWRRGVSFEARRHNFKILEKKSQNTFY